MGRALGGSGLALRGRCRARSGALAVAYEAPCTPRRPLGPAPLTPPPRGWCWTSCTRGGSAWKGPGVEGESLRFAFGEMGPSA